MSKYQCVSACGYIYNPKNGDPKRGIHQGTSFENLPDDWVCPVCGIRKSIFKKID
ncbi:MAG: rubredoxin [Nitrospira sp.]|nr:rubredoxin [Nitrospira sp.]